MPIKHLFVLMLENRSFDHMLGFADLTGPDAVTGQQTHADDLVLLQQRPDKWKRTGNLNPASGELIYPQSGALHRLSSPAPGPGHEFNDVLEQLCGAGAKLPAGGGYPAITGTGFVSNYVSIGRGDPADDPADDPALVMKCFRPEQLPVLTTLAREYAVCDRWFCSIPGPTWPNRFFVHAATSGGLYSSPPGLDVLIHEIGPGYQFQNGTIFDRLGNDWLVFHGDPLPHVFSIAGMLGERLQGRFKPQRRFDEIVHDHGFSAKYIFIEPNYGRVYGDYAYGTSQHPLDDVAQGEKLIKEVYESIRSSPHWNESALVVTYDEHGGFYDHVTPPDAVAPGDTVSARSTNESGFDFKRLGVRVPAVVVSPLVEKGTIDHRVYDHASVPATLVDLFNLPPVNGQRHLTNRDAAATSFKTLFSRAAARTDTLAKLPDPPPLAPVPASADEDDIINGNLDPNTRGFLYIALLRRYGITAKDVEHSPGLKRYMRIRTRKGARQCIEQVRKQFENT